MPPGLRTSPSQKKLRTLLATLVCNMEYRSAGPTLKISKGSHADIREIHWTLPVMLLFLLSDIDGPGQGHALEDCAMRFSPVFIASLMCGLSGTAMSQTQPLTGGTPLPSVVVGAPKQSVSQPKRGPRAVAHSAAPLRTSIASASDAPVYGRDTLASTTGNCSTTTWPVVSPVQCTKPFAHNYVECTEMVAKNGSISGDAWWWCSNQGFKN